MNEMTPPVGRDPQPPGRPPSTTAQQDTLPFDQLPPVALPYDDEVDRPIAFSLTARARRVVAPRDLPSLRVIDDDGALEQPNDTRPARARALHRAGVPLADISRQLDVEDLVVHAWVGELVPTAGARHDRVGAPRRARLRSVPTPDAPTPASSSTVVSAPSVATDQRPPTADDTATDGDQVRRSAVDEARWRLADDPGFAAGVGMLAASATIDQFSVTVTSDRAQLVGAMTAWLYANTSCAPDAVRVVLRLAPDAAADLERHRWANELGVPLARVSYTRGGNTPPDTVALMRIHDPDLASRVAGWRDALLNPSDATADVAF